MRTVYTIADSHIPMSERRAFRAGNVWGQPADSATGFSSGWMPPEIRARFIADAPTYIIHSRYTPIGWLAADGRAVVPEHTYSTSTSNHQSAARSGLARAIAPTREIAHTYRWVEGVAVHPDTLIRVSARKYRSRVDSARYDIGTMTVGQAFNLQANEYRAPVKSHSDIRFHLLSLAPFTPEY